MESRIGKADGGCCVLIGDKTVDTHPIQMCKQLSGFVKGSATIDRFPLNQTI